jgi:hypothetical protein
MPLKTKPITPLLPESLSLPFSKPFLPSFSENEHAKTFVGDRPTYAMKEEQGISTKRALISVHSSPFVV